MCSEMDDNYLHRDIRMLVFTMPAGLQADTVKTLKTLHLKITFATINKRMTQVFKHKIALVLFTLDLADYLVLC